MSAVETMNRAMDAQIEGKLERRTRDFLERAIDLRAISRLARRVAMVESEVPGR